jgi:hypothetical protein
MEFMRPRPFGSGTMAEGFGHADALSVQHSAQRQERET